jgi:hypothetical protein
MPVWTAVCPTLSELFGRSNINPGPDIPGGDGAEIPNAEADEPTFPRRDSMPPSSVSPRTTDPGGFSDRCGRGGAADDVVTGLEIGCQRKLITKRGNKLGAAGKGVAGRKFEADGILPLVELTD